MRAPHPALRGLYRQASLASAFAARMTQAHEACAAAEQTFDFAPLAGERDLAALLAGSAVNARLASPLARLDTLQDLGNDTVAEPVRTRRAPWPETPAQPARSRTAPSPSAAFDPERHPRIAALRKARSIAGSTAAFNPEQHPRVAARRLISSAWAAKVDASSSPFAHPFDAAARPARTGPAGADSKASRPAGIDAAAAQARLAAVAARTGFGRVHEQIVADSAVAPRTALSSFSNNNAKPPEAETGSALLPATTVQLNRALKRLGSGSTPTQSATSSSAAPVSTKVTGIGSRASTSNSPQPMRAERRSPFEATARAATATAIDPAPPAHSGLTGLRRLAALARPAAVAAASPQSAFAGAEVRASLLPAGPATGPASLADELAAILRREAERHGIDLNNGGPP